MGGKLILLQEHLVLDSSWTGSLSGEQAGMFLAALAMLSWPEPHHLSIFQCHGSHLGPDSYPSLASWAPGPAPETCRIPPPLSLWLFLDTRTRDSWTSSANLPTPALSISDLLILRMLIEVPWAFLQATELPTWLISRHFKLTTSKF